ncbi:hypothetical protein ESCO_004494 [Escovopsis weberi]|uniref:DUF4604 domain-containing protein n=1 Tax=Escovopsis weberi TaxID=150374 RepID=A0A0M9VVG5_ESCWE|nr:hypothetical protein ESCO_004494 [Escovopsis weberi]
MSQKITAKNLSYDSSLPPFLAALRAQAAGHAQSPTPQRRGAAKKRSASEDREDAPLVVDEHGNAIDLDDLEAREEPDPEPSLTGSANQRRQQQDDGKPAAETKSAMSVGVGVGVGAGKKRKVGKKVGGEETDAADDKVGRRERKKHDGGDDQDAKKEGPVKAVTSSDSRASTGKKKAKKIKLSFDEAEG